MKKIFIHLCLIINYLRYNFALNVNNFNSETKKNSLSTVKNLNDDIDYGFANTNYDYIDDFDDSFDLNNDDENLSNINNSIIDRMTSEEFLTQEKLKIQNLTLETEKYEKITANINNIIKNQTEKFLGVSHAQKFKNFVKIDGREIGKNNLNNNFTVEINNTNITLGTNNSISMPVTNYTSKLKNLTSTTSAESLMASIEYQTQFIKQEICLNSCEISDALDLLMSAIINIEHNIKELQINSQKTLDVIINSINKVNIIKADITRLNEIISTIQKVNCPSLTQSGKKIELVLHSVNKLIELITETIKNLKLNLNLVILT